MEKTVTSLKNKKETNLAFVINHVTQNKLKQAILKYKGKKFTKFNYSNSIRL